MCQRIDAYLLVHTTSRCRSWWKLLQQPFWRFLLSGSPDDWFDIPLRWKDMLMMIRRIFDNVYMLAWLCLVKDVKYLHGRDITVLYSCTDTQVLAEYRRKFIPQTPHSRLAPISPGPDSTASRISEASMIWQLIQFPRLPCIGPLWPDTSSHQLV